MSGFMPGGGGAPRTRSQGYLPALGYSPGSVAAYGQSDSDNEMLAASRYSSGGEYGMSTSVGNTPGLGGNVGYMDGSRAAAAAVAAAAAASSMQSYYPPASSAAGYGGMNMSYGYQPYMQQYGSGGGAPAAAAAAYYSQYSPAAAAAAAAAAAVARGGAGPGAPIQTTKDLQGPDGCNLFVFHIPNDMTNMDLYSLFAQFGNVISARIMVDKQSGRSRGFGFVSFDYRPSAESAIKGMNGYQIGRKRLKVQHKKEKDRGADVARRVTTRTHGSLPQFRQDDGLHDGGIDGLTDEERQEYEAAAAAAAHHQAHLAGGGGDERVHGADVDGVGAPGIYGGSGRASPEEAAAAAAAAAAAGGSSGGGGGGGGGAGAGPGSASPRANWGDALGGGVGKDPGRVASPPAAGMWGDGTAAAAAAAVARVASPPMPPPTSGPLAAPGWDTATPVPSVAAGWDKVDAAGGASAASVEASMAGLSLSDK